MAADTGFEIDGAFYDLPTLGSLNMEEAQVLYDYSGLSVEDFVPPRPDTEDDAKREHQDALVQKMKNPALMRALLHIAYQRGNPEVRPAVVKDLVGRVNQVDALISLANADREEDDVPLALTPEPDRQSQSGSGGSNTSSGEGSRNSSDAPEDTQGTTGPTRSDTSPTSDRKLSVA